MADCIGTAKCTGDSRSRSTLPGQPAGQAGQALIELMAELEAERIGVARLPLAIPGPIDLPVRARWMAGVGILTAEDQLKARREMVPARARASEY